MTSSHNLHLSRGVGRNLFISFMIVSLFSLTSAVIGWFGLGSVRDVQNRVLNEVYPSVRIAQSVARESTEWVLRLPSLFESRTIEQLDTRTKLVKSSERRIFELLSEVDDTETSQILRAEIGPKIQELSKHVESAIVLARQLIQINKIIPERSGEIQNISEIIVDTIKLKTISIVEGAILNSEEITRMLQSNAAGNNVAVSEKFENFSRGTIDNLQKITDLQFKSEAIVGDLLRLADAESSDRVRTIRDSLILDVRAVTRSIVSFGIPELQQKLATPLSQLSSEVFRDDSIFALHESASIKRDEMSKIRISAATIQHEISTLVEQFVRDAQSVMESESARAQQGSARIQYILAALAILAFIVSAFVYVYYVNDMIIARLHRLSVSVKRLVSGDFADSVVKTGDDQITRLEEAVEAFRRNSIRLRAAETSLTEYSENLERSNKDLQQFAYVASHDLRAPLRGINSLAEWLEEDLAEGNTKEAVQKISRLRGRVGRMDELLTGILRYARAGNEGDESEHIPFERTVRQIFGDLNANGRFHVEIKSEMDTLFTGTTFLKQVLGNLISNAMKHHDKETGNIEVELRSDGKFNTLSVSDDGPGIPANMREKVLQIFQTLKSRDEVEASGIGLALVDRLTIRRGGSVNIQNSASGGTCFVVRWPCETE